MRRDRGGRNARLAGVAVLAAVLTAGLATWPWSNADGDAPTASAQETDGVAPSEAEAAAEAAASGEPVEVLALRSEQRDVWAQPDGSFVAHEYASPVRTWIDGAWVDIDTTLETAEDGSIGPVAATVRMRFSTGGDEPLVTVAKNGHEMTLDWAGTLPAPSLEGDTAVYAEVLPGVDLRVRALPTGFTHTLVVGTAEAAQQPELETIEWPVTLDGSAVETTPEGGLDVVDAGTFDAWLSAEAPVMWDSSGVDEATEAVPSVGARDLSDSAVAQATAREFGSVSGVGVSGDGTSIVLTPDQELLTGPDTVYPVYIDPEYVDSLRTAWAYVDEAYPSESYWKWDDHEGVGTWTDNGPIKRQFFRMPTSAYRGKDIMSAEFAVTVAYNWYSDDRETGFNIDLDRISGFSSSTTWNNQPGGSEIATADAPAPAGNDACATPSKSSDHAMEWDITSTIQDRADAGKSTISVRLRNWDETEGRRWIRICNNAHLRVHYNTPPDQPDTDDMYSTPGPACAYAISADSYVNEWPVLHATGTDPDDDQVRMRFRLVWGANSANQWYSPWSSYKASGSEFTLDLATASGVPDLPEGEPIGWIAQTSDGEAVSSWSWAGAPARCRFTYDGTVPDPPSVSSNDFPIGSDGEPDPIVPMVGQLGQLTLSTADDDIAAYKVDFNKDDEGPRTITLDSLGADAVVEFLPTVPGRQVATVVAVDAAGNSASNSYSFRVSASDPAGVWALGDDEGSDEAADLDGSNPGTPGGGVIFGADGPGTMTAASFDGTADAYIDTGVYDVAPTGQGAAIAAWARVDDLSRDGVIASIDGGLGEAGLILGYRSTSATSGEWVLSMPDMPVGAFTSWEATGGQVTTSNQDQWVHLVGVWDDYTGQMTLYLNGAEVASAARETTWSGDGTVQIGRANIGGFWDDQFAGRIADVRVFDRVVPAAEAEELGWQTAIRQGLWQFNTVGDTGSPEFDGGPEAVLSGGADIYTQADPDFDDPALVGDGHLQLDGVDGAAAVDDPVAGTARSFSISARVRIDTDAASGPMTVLSIPGSNVPAMEVVYAPDCDGEGNACWRLRAAVADEADADLITVDGALAPSDAADGQELTVVFDATTGQLRLYVDGAAAVAEDDDLLLTSWTATSGLQVGHSDTGGYFAGAVDDVRVYSGVLHPTVIASLAIAPQGDRPEI
ncbi:LamG-like jellyroll fold domain-containing protein [Glycomyces salinus]|uniref:LamG-like jellyroll fold domain-containing protein n=1 Tax=Glycomyces salinus TaxID=980294 RepID=UPI0018EDF066|nr:LamG-like jellyroll fold domain-containing protein [Glycomyces salinus]